MGLDTGTGKEQRNSPAGRQATSNFFLLLSLFVVMTNDRLCGVWQKDGGVGLKRVIFCVRVFWGGRACCVHAFHVLCKKIMYV